MTRWNFAVLKDTGIAQGEFAYIVGCSRIMVNRYVQGKAEPSARNAAKIHRALVLLERLRLQGKLPLPDEFGSETRARKIEKIKAHLALQR